ncbi:MAG TPA: LamG-like jellyroll fold domain-containing protein [Lacunisphaera sp.]|nr:LamG-like jellyroll fold domain-containing protein [Lacunisphaera sp.]
MPRFPRVCVAVPFLALLALARAGTPSNGLLFEVTGKTGTTADFAANGQPKPTFDAEVEKIADGAPGPALSCADHQTLAWRAPGNLYAQRGTLAFFWRSRYPVGPTEFPLFRVGYADHSSWDMTWLRVDYNGHGVEAFVTDRDLARWRVAAEVAPFPAPDRWLHVAFAWDETQGVRLFLDGRLVAEKKMSGVLDAGLDQFGPHSRIISPYQVQSDYNFTRGGDIDEIRIYDRMLGPADIATLARGEKPSLPAAQPRDPGDTLVRREWAARHAWGSAIAVPVLPAAPSVRVRKVEFTDAYDLKRWWWKACDGIRETTWPGVYNRSRIAGRTDYFVLPDWDCYVDSGRMLSFALPDEDWNHLEISGGAGGVVQRISAEGPMEDASTVGFQEVLLRRPEGAERTAHEMPRQHGGRIRFRADLKESPLGEVAAYLIEPGGEPAGSKQVEFAFAAASPAVGSRPEIDRLESFIAGRFPPDERATLVGMPAGDQPVAPGEPGERGLPVVHLLLPETWTGDDGLDGIALDLPALSAAGGAASIPIQISIKDPLWSLRELAGVTVGLRVGAPVTLWLDTRDRLLPKGRGLWISIEGRGAEISAQALRQARVRLVFKPRAAARAEHVADRFAQARDAYAMLVEEHPHSEKFDLWNRFKGDLEDVLAADPEHRLARQYAVAAGLARFSPELVPPPSVPPPGVPRWAVRQVELLGRAKRFVNWYIDHRQVAYGDFGGGISDDVDLTNLWPGLALMGAEPEKLRDSARRLLEAAYRNGMFTHGLPTIQADELHSYEEGINCLAQNLLLDPGNPRLLERAMETSRGVESLTGVNAAGHRHIRSSYYSGTRVATDAPWNRQKPYSFLVCQVPQLLVAFNGNPRARRMNEELAAGLLAHLSGDDERRLLTAVEFDTDREIEASRGLLPWHVLWSAWRSSGDRRYLEPILATGLAGISAVNANLIDELGQREEWRRRQGGGEKPAALELRRRGAASSNSGRSSAPEFFTWQLFGDKDRLAELFERQIAGCDALEFINTEGSLWIDRVGVPTGDLQRARLGGVGLLRNAPLPGNRISWRFAQAGDDEKVALLLPDATAGSLRVVACNLSDQPVEAEMIGADVLPGQWEFTQGTDANDDDRADHPGEPRRQDFGRDQAMRLVFPAHATVVVEGRCVAEGVPYWQRPDLGIGPEDVAGTASEITVKVHSLGAVATPAAVLAVLDGDGHELARAAVPALEAPVDLEPRSVVVRCALPAGATAAIVRVITAGPIPEITARNNEVRLNQPAAPGQP